MSEGTKVFSASAEIAKDRLQALKGTPVLPNTECMFVGIECSETEYDFLDKKFYGLSPTKDAALNALIDYRKSTKAEPVVADSVAATLAQRGSRYGDFTDHARICQALKEVMLETTGPSSAPEPRGWRYLSDVQKQALEVIADKIARILSGDPNYDDNWHDIQGYAKLVEDRLPKNSGV